MPSDDLAELHAREIGFHDALAAELDPAAMPPEAPGRLEHAILAGAGLRPGERVLDLGCGSGDLTLELAARGADVTALDLSPGMVDVASRRVELFAPRAVCKFVAAPIEESGLEAQSFDVIVGRYILHHLDLDSVAPVLAKLLVDGGRAVFGETSGRNPILMFARDNLAGRFGIPRLGTPDEHPLTDADVARLAPFFREVGVSYPVFEFFFLFDRQVLRFRWSGVSRLIDAIDQFIYRRIQSARPYSFRMIVTMRK
jgi:SAM-dependent methyltransferase